MKEYARKSVGLKIAYLYINEYIIICLKFINQNKNDMAGTIKTRQGWAQKLENLIVTLNKLELKLSSNVLYT